MFNLLAHWPTSTAGSIYFTFQFIGKSELMMRLAYGQFPSY